MRRTVMFAILAAVLMAAVPLSMTDGGSDAGYAQSDSITVSPSISDISLEAGGSIDLYLDIHNKLDRTDTDPNTLVIYVMMVPQDHIDATYPDGQRIEIGGQEIGSCKVHLHVDEYSPEDSYSISFTITINDPDRGYPIRADASDTFSITVHSKYSSADYYNKFFGVWDNNMPAPLDGAWFPALITFLTVLLAAIAVIIYVIPAVNRIFSKKGDDEK